MANSPQLDDWERLQWLSEKESTRQREEAGAADAEREKEMQRRIDQDDIKRKHEEVRQKQLVKKYVVPMLDPYAPRRKELARRISREIKDKQERIFIVSKLIQASGIVGKQKRKDWNKKGAIERFANKVSEVPMAFLHGTEGIAEAYGDLGRAFGTGFKEDKKDMLMQDLLESAYQYGGPEKQNKDSLAHKFVKGTAEISPQILIGMKAYTGFGKLGVGAQTGTMSFGPQFRRLKSEGAGGLEAAVGAGVTSAAVGAVETAIPVVGRGLSGLGRAGGEVGTSVARRAGWTGMRRTASEKIGSAFAEYLGEVGEEYVQGGIEQAGSLASAAIGDRTEGRSLMEIPKAGFEATQESALPLAGVAGIGGGSRIALAHSNARTRAAVRDWAENERPPSRREWQDAGFPMGEDGKVPPTRERLQHVQDLNDMFNTDEAAARDAEEAAGAAVAEEPVEVPDAPAALQEALLGDQAAPQSAQQEPVGPPEGAMPRQEPVEMAQPGLQEMFAVAAERAQQMEPPSQITPNTALETTEKLSPEEHEELRELNQTLSGFMSEERGSLAIPVPKVINDAVAGLQGKQAEAAMSSPVAENERRLESSSNVQDPGFWKQALERIGNLMGKMVRSKEHIPNFGGKFDVAREYFRLMDATPASAQELAARQVAAIVKRLGPTQNKLFERYLITQNQLRSLRMVAENIDPDTGAVETVPAPEPLRQGFESEKQTIEYAQQLSALVQGTPAVRAALQARGKMVRAMSEKLVAANLLPESALDDVDGYFHQEVLLYRNAFKEGQTAAADMGWMKRRIKGVESMAEEFDYVTSYIEPELAWLASAHQALARREFAGKVDEQYNRLDEFVATAERDGRTLGAVAREEGYEVGPSTLLYGPNASSIPSIVQDHFQQAVAEDLNMEQAETELATGGELAGKIALPKEIMRQLKHDQMTTLPNSMAEFHRDMLKSWKAWTLLNPKRIIGYNVRNITGDIDPILAANPKILLKVSQATREMWQFRNKFDEATPEAIAAMKYGVLSSGITQNELSRATESKLFKWLGRKSDGGLTKVVAKPFTAYADLARSGTELRENILRYAAYLQYLDEVKSGKLKHYGGSVARSVEAVRKRFGPEAAAAKLSRELLGDYGNLSLTGQFFRRHLLPFWSFVEVNMTRYPHILKNAFHSPKGVTATGVGIGSVVAMRGAMLFGAIQAWNHLMAPIVYDDDELWADLGDYDRNGLGIILGRNEDGTVRVFRNVGALGDLMSWFGINEAASFVPRAANGQMDWSEVGTEMATAPAEKIVGLLHPLAKAVPEVGSGQSFFPDPWNPRAQDRGEAVANIVGMSEELKAARGWYQQSGEIARPHYFQRMLWGVADPGQAARGEMYSLRDAYLKQKGDERAVPRAISKYKLMTDAAAANNKDAFRNWRANFIETNGKMKAGKLFWGKLKNFDPISGSLSDYDEWKFDKEFLTTGQQQKLAKSKEYSQLLRSRLARWWVEIVQEESKGKKLGF